MKVLSIDPGAKPAYAKLSLDGLHVPRPFGIGPAPRVYQVGLSLADMVPGWDAVAVEGQWEPHEDDEGHKPRVTDILKLAFRAGVQGDRASAGGARPLYKVPPALWRETLGGRSVTAAVIYNRILEALTADERALLPDAPEARLRDCAAAIGIGWAWSKLAPSAREKCREIVR